MKFKRGTLEESWEEEKAAFITGDSDPLGNLPEQHHAAAVELIGNVAGDQRQQHRGQKLHQADQPEVERPACHRVNLPAHHNGKHLETEAGSRTGYPESDKRAVL